MLPLVIFEEHPLFRAKAGALLPFLSGGRQVLDLFLKSGLVMPLTLASLTGSDFLDILSKE